jgi:hypothetical protein
LFSGLAATGVQAEGIESSESNPFAINELSSGYMFVAEADKEKKGSSKMKLLIALSSKLINYANRKIVAKPKNDIKPITSVTVVSKTPPASAGSIPFLCKNKGIITPAKAAQLKFIIIAPPSIF